MRYIFIFLVLFYIPVYSQQLFPLNRDLNLKIQQATFYKNSSINFSNYPLQENDIKASINLDSILGFQNRDTALLSDMKSGLLKFLWKKLRNESLIMVNKPDFKLSIDPLFDFGKSNDKELSYKPYINRRGALIKGTVSNSVAFYSCFYETQQSFLDYIDNKVKMTDVVPGDGRVKQFKNNPFIYDYSTAAGYVSYSAPKFFNVQFGHYKNFFGNGYRSLLLSDNSFNYPFLKLYFNSGYFHYTSLYTSYQLPRYKNKEEKVFPKKYATYHFFSFNYKAINIGLFESTLWKAFDKDKNIPFRAYYLNPVPVIQSLKYKFDDLNNNIVGLNISLRLFKYHCLYGQYMVDDPGNNKTGFQIGYKYFNMFGIKNLNLLTEYNVVKDYTYTSSDSLQNYVHYYQPLAHPLGAGFLESVSFLSYRYKDFFIEFKYLYSEIRTDFTNKTGNNILISEPTNVADKNFYLTKLTYKNLRLNYLVNPSSNFNVYFEISQRYEKNDIPGSVKYDKLFYSFGIRTAIDNYYFDF